MEQRILLARSPAFGAGSSRPTFSRRSTRSVRISDRRQIEKWFKRNCKWTLGRECTLQEKGDLLSFLRNE